MAISFATKATLETRMKAMLAASAPATLWVTGALDEALTMVLEEYTRVRPFPVVYVQTPAAREFAMSGVTSPLGVTRVWFPYTAAAPEFPPAWVDFDFWFDGGGGHLLLHTPAVPNGAQVARIWYNALHTISGLTGAIVTTFDGGDDGLIVTGAVGYALLQRSTELDENTANMAISTPNYGALAEIFLQRFHDGLYVIGSRGTRI
jgi:hypothetical protein